MSEALLGVLIGGVIGLLGSLLVGWLQDRRRTLEYARSIRGMPLDNLLAVVNSVTSLTTQHILANAYKSSGLAPDRYREKLIDAGMTAINDIQRARVSMMAIDATSEVQLDLRDLTVLLESLPSLPEEKLGDAIEKMMAVLSRIEKQYKDRRLALDPL